MKIGLTYTGTEKKHDNYARWIKGDDQSIEIVRLAAEEDNLAALADCDGLVLSGGVDIDPVFYDGIIEYVKAPATGWRRDRDDFEMSALFNAFERKLPVLGVCRGLQLINVALGGSLVQDLGVQGDEIHENVTGIDKQHTVNILPGTLLSAIVKKLKGTVNSAHHQSIDRLGDNLRVNCRAEDGTIEGIEWANQENHPFLVGVQWHPERMYVNRLEDGFLYDNIRDRFIKAIKNNE